jgi:spermidine synthase
LVITQAGSPYYAAKAFNCIDKTMREAGFATVPLHNQVITLGEWGWIFGAKDGNSEKLTRALKSLDFENPKIETRWINHDAMTLVTSFGKTLFEDDTIGIEINKIHNPVLYKYYLDGKWEFY